MKDRGEYFHWLSVNKVSEVELTDYGLRLRDAYLKRRRNFYPEYRMEAALFNDEQGWRKLAIKLWEIQPDPNDYASAQFAAYKNVMPPPRAIMGDKGVENFETWKSNSHLAQPEAMNLLQTSAEIYALRRKQYPELSAVQIFDHPQTQCDALFKWCILMRLGLPGAAAKYQKLASILVTTPGYRATYSVLFPGLTQGKGP